MTFDIGYFISMQVRHSFDFFSASLFTFCCILRSVHKFIGPSNDSWEVLCFTHVLYLLFLTIKNP